MFFVILRDFIYFNNALLGLVKENDPCDTLGNRIIQDNSGVLFGRFQHQTLKI